jgi:LemA protein
MFVFIFIGIVLVVIIVVIVMYNSMKSKSLKVDQTFSNVEVILEQRYDTLSNVIELVKRYTDYEKGVLETIVALREKLTVPGVKQDEKVAIHNQLNDAISQFNIQLENYPQLKANENFMQAQQIANNLEENISAARRAFNSQVNEYNTAISMFPSSIIAGIFSFKEKALFKGSENKKEASVASFFER